MRLSPLLLLLLSYPTLGAADAKLEALRSTLVSMRGQDLKQGPRGATPQLTVVKHQLRDWVESRLPALKQRGDAAELELTLNNDLRKQKLVFNYYDDEDPGSHIDPWNLFGYVSPISLQREGVFLVLTSGVGISCGSDQSAYIYSWSGESWTRVWQNEQNTYSEKGYKPQTISAVHISPYNRGNDYLVLTLGFEPWCSSVMHPVYYRVFRLGGDLQAAAMLDNEEMAFLDKDPPIQGSIAFNDVLVEFTQGALLPGDRRPAIRHYRVTHDQVERIHPLAIGPQAFLSEWLDAGWRYAAVWSENEGRPALSDFRRRAEKLPVREATWPSMHCPATPDLWQVRIDLGADEKDSKPAYFTIRWRPPYRFSMVKVSDHPSLTCNEEDAGADDPTRTLFPVQAWR